MDFPGNPIEILEDDIFMHKNLLNLQEISLRACQIHTIDPNSFRYAYRIFLVLYALHGKTFDIRTLLILFLLPLFRQLRNLDRLDLSTNDLREVPSRAMMPITQLRELQLSKNPIQRLKNFAFTYLTQLIRLGLFNIM